MNALEKYRREMQQFEEYQRQYLQQRVKHLEYEVNQELTHRTNMHEIAHSQDRKAFLTRTNQNLVDEKIKLNRFISSIDDFIRRT